jgi:hypothetical protein
MTDNATFDVSEKRPANVVRVISDNESVLSGGDAMTDAGFEAVSSEITVGQFLGVSVIRGRPIAKKVGERKTHPSYEVRVVHCCPRTGVISISVILVCVSER